MDISGVSATMESIERSYPGARRALFRAYHIGGCASCAYRPEETLAQVCARQDPPVDAQSALEVIRRAGEEEARLLISPAELRDLRERGQPVRLVDIRSREEHEAVRISGAEMLTPELSQELLHGQGRERGEMIVFIDHAGRHVLDAVSYFIGHGLAGARGLRGGIDAWAVEVDPEMPRYVLETGAASSSGA